MSTLIHSKNNNQSHNCTLLPLVPVATLSTAPPTCGCSRQCSTGYTPPHRSTTMCHRVLQLTHIILLTTLTVYSGNSLVTAAPSHHQSHTSSSYAAASALILNPALANSLNASAFVQEQSNTFLDNNSAHENNAAGGSAHHEHGARALKRALLSNRSIVCNDGSAMSFYLRKNPNSKKWIVFLEGGWHCYDVKTCRARWNRLRHLMTSTDWPETRDGMY